MAFTPAPGHPSYSGNYIPWIFAKQVLVKFYDRTVLKAISNTDYQGVISNYGDTVYIRQRPDIDTFDYVPGMVLPKQYPDTSPITLLIDKAKGWNFLVDDITEAQSDLNLISDWSDDGAEQIKVAIDTQILGSIYGDVHADNLGTTAGTVSGAFNLGASTTPIAVDKTNFVDYLVHLGSVLDESNTPAEGRWIVIPPLFANLLTRSELKDASLSGDRESMLRRGYQGNIANMAVYQSNNVASVADGSGVTAYYIMAGHPKAFSFAMQITKSETLRSTDTFSDIIRALSVYGWKVTKPLNMALLYANAVIN